MENPVSLKDLGDICTGPVLPGGWEDKVPLQAKLGTGCWLSANRSVQEISPGTAPLFPEILPCLGQEESKTTRSPALWADLEKNSATLFSLPTQGLAGTHYDIILYHDLT